MYEPASSFGVQQWIRQIAKRAAIQGAINANDKGLLGVLVPELISEPLADWPFEYRNTTQTIKDLDYATRSVIPLAFSDLDRLQRLRQNFPSTHDGISAVNYVSVAC